MITSEQEKYIIDNYMNMTYEEIGKVIGKNKNTVAYYAKKNRLDGKRDLHLSEEDMQFMKDNYMTKSYSEIGAVVGLTSKQVEGWLRNHIDDKESKRREFNSDYFSDITTGEQAYWIGFIYADGWISMNPRSQNSKYLSYEFGIELQRKDEYMLYALNEALGSKHIIQRLHSESRILDNRNITVTDSSVLRVYSKELVLDLLKAGIDTHKTVSDMFPIVWDDLFPDFLRGYIDGDGCIYYTNRNRLAVHITGANVRIFEYIRDKLYHEFGIHSNIYHSDSDTYLTKYRLMCFRNESVKALLDLIYRDSDSIKLVRKYNIYKDFYGLAA